MAAAALLLMAVGTLGRPHLLLLMTPFAGLVCPILAEGGDLSPLVGLVAGGAGHFLHLLVFFVGEGDVTVFGLKDDDCGVLGNGKAGTAEGQCDSSNDLFHTGALLLTWM